jgi:hypothetical protein
MTPNDAALLMDQINHGRGPGSTVALDQARHMYSRQITAMGRPQTMQGHEIISRGHDWARTQGISESEWKSMNAIERGTLFGNKRTYKVPGVLDTSTLPMGRVEALRRQTINALGNTLTDKEKAELTKHIGDRHWSFDKAIARYETSRGRFGSSSSVDVNGVTITLKGKAAKILDINAPNRQAVATGQMPSNQQYTTENSRLWNTGYGG